MSHNIISELDNIEMGVFLIVSFKINFIIFLNSNLRCLLSKIVDEINIRMNTLFKIMNT